MRSLPFVVLLAGSSQTVDPNTLDWSGDTALHAAVSSFNVDPTLIRLLIHRFGADPALPNIRGRIPFDLLTASSRYVLRSNFRTELDFREWQERMRASARLLQRVKRITAVMMGVHCVGSVLFRLDLPLAALVLRFCDLC